MKKNHLLKLALIIAFIALLFNALGDNAYRSFITGYNKADHNSLHQNQDIEVLIDGNTFIRENKGVVNIDSLRRLENVRINARLITNDHGIPLYLDILNMLVTIAALYILIGILRRTYQVITAISNNEAFELPVINNLKRIGYYFLLGFVLAFTIDRITIIKNTIMAGPKLHLVHDTDWQMDFLVIGFLVLLIARAFEQGMKLSEEQKLTI